MKTWGRGLAGLLAAGLLAGAPGCGRPETQETMAGAQTTSTAAATTTAATTAGTDATSGSIAFDPVSTTDKTTPTTRTKSTSGASTAAPSVQAKLRAAMKTSSVRGLSLVAFRDKEIVFSFYDGYMDAKKTKLVNANTKYRIASVSKTITGILAMQLQEQGRLDIDKDISAYMGVRVRSPKYPDAVITTRMLMTHTSGVIGGAAYDKNTGDPPYQPLTAVLESSGCFTGSRPGKSFRYSNMGAAMEGGVIEGVTGKRFYDYAGEQFAALGMDAGYLRTKIKDTASISPARSADVPNWKRVEGAYDTIPLGQMYLLGHGDLIISAQDLAQFAIALAGDGSTKTHRILSAESVKAINTVYSHSGKDGIGLNMSMTKDLADGRLIYGHSGQAYGMIAGLYFDPVDHTGVVFITNSASTAKNRKGKYTLTGNLMEILYRDVLGAPAYKGGPIAAPTGSIPMPEDKG